MGVTGHRIVPDHEGGPGKRGFVAVVTRGVPVTWNGHGRHGYGGVPWHRRGRAGVSGVNVAFDVVFGIFVAAILVLAVVAVRWGVRRDRMSRAQRLRQLPAAGGRGETPVAPGPRSDPSAP